ncbi:MAG: acetyl-CoA carboxylase carboxyl transferase subunit beta [Oscillospiraceae bacterium]|jgi:acetyl-CoA carboxylase carboxyl transferase subunit beta|nr:acetyl-CoA carboxylase carboxyl transferase subunit beta [Oscillospiraceae bacterium]
MSDNFIGAFLERRRTLNALKKTRERTRATNLTRSASGPICPKCGKPAAKTALYLCSKCGYHYSMPARARLDRLFDVAEGSPGATPPLFAEIMSRDPLDFPGYGEKLAEARARTGLSDAFHCREGTINGRAVIALALEPAFMMGSMGTAVGEGVALAFERAGEKGVPVIIFSASGGARMQEGIFSLMQMAKTAVAARAFSDSGGLYVSVMTNPTTGGVTASFASLGDIILAEPGALIGFAGPRVIEQTMGAKLPEGFQRAEFQLAHGFIDAIIPRTEMRAAISRLLRLHPERSAAL